MKALICALPKIGGTDLREKAFQFDETSDECGQLCNPDLYFLLIHITLKLYSFHRV
ncbi:MAG: hypothetical protein ACJAWV_002338 [Flammeovirgaceae bacterium]|jgi:hypothetical protein